MSNLEAAKQERPMWELQRICHFLQDLLGLAPVWEQDMADVRLSSGVKKVDILYMPTIGDASQ
eukprot:5725960-Prorocentrum_lima.AAC.1